jgi:L-proline---[L-prolyl-carrier protein] ligase
VSARLVHELLTRAAAAHPERTAVVDRERRVTYAELDERSSRLAAALADAGVAPGDRVGLYLNKSLEAIVGVYGVLKAGATYVPFDDQAPATRLAYVASNAGIRCLVTEAEKAHGWATMAELGAPLEALVVSGGAAQAPDGVRVIEWAALDAYPATAPSVPTAPDDLAYILYTSGSTGDPKGVMLSHENALAFVEWAVEEVGVRHDDRVSSHAPLHFDLSTFDLFGAAAAAAELVLFSRDDSVFPVELANRIRDTGITIWYSVPSILALLATRGGLDRAPLPELRAVLFAGEVFPTKYLDRLMELIPQARFYNLFGPTETNVCTWYEVPRPGPDRPDPIPIGAPIAGVEIVVADEEGREVDEGEAGELLVTGPTVMHGYWGDAERTARVLSSADGKRTYHTGDLVRRHVDGSLLFLGRRDAQIKSRGYRIELGDIEHALGQLDRVAECAVVAVPDELVTNRIKAIVVPNGELTDAEVVRFCGERLPRYMVPDEVEFRETLPRSSTGKIDRRRLDST